MSIFNASNIGESMRARLRRERLLAHAMICAKDAPDPAVPKSTAIQTKLALPPGGGDDEEEGRKEDS